MIQLIRVTTHECKAMIVTHLCQSTDLRSGNDTMEPLIQLIAIRLSQFLELCLPEPVNGCLFHAWWPVWMCRVLLIMGRTEIIFYYIIFIIVCSEAKWLESVLWTEKWAHWLVNDFETRYHNAYAIKTSSENPSNIQSYYPLLVFQVTFSLSTAPS